MSDCLGLYIENHLIKYAKVSKERENTKIEAFGIKTYDKLDDAIKQIVQETYSFKTPISVNLSDEMYNYFNVFSMLNKKDIERAIKTEFEFLCEERGFNKNVLEAKYFSVENKEDEEKLRTIHISANKAEIARKSQQMEGYKLRNISPLPISIANLVEINPQENIAIVNIEEKTSITIIVDGQIYKVEMLEDGMQEIFDKINIKENSYTKAYEICKNTTIYTMEGKSLQLEESEYLEEIMPTLYNIVTKTKDIVSDEALNINRLYITGSGAIINNVDLYFQENLKQQKCEILKPYFVQTETVRLNIKDYIEVNSAIAMALQGLGEGLKGVNFKELGFWDKVDMPTLGGGKEKGDKKGGLFSNVSLSLDFGGEFDNVERWLLRLAGTVLMVIILYSALSFIIGKQIENKENEVLAAIQQINEQVALVDKDVNSIKTRTNDYNNLIQNLQALNERTTEKYKTRNAIPNLLNRIMSSIPKNVQLTSIANTSGTHIVIKAQSAKYEQLGMFKAQLIVDNVLLNVKSDSSIKQDGLVKVTIEGELP